MHKNIYTEAAIRLADRLTELRKRAESGAVVPFGEEEVSAAVLRERLERDVPLRKELLGRKGGRETILRLYRGKEE